MKLVIDIPEDVYTRLFDNGIQDNEIAVDDVCEMARAIRLGISLPKGHGDLIDKKEVYRKFYKEVYRKFYSRCLAKGAKEVLEKTPTVIPADK